MCGAAAVRRSDCRLGRPLSQREETFGAAHPRRRAVGRPPLEARAIGTSVRGRRRLDDAHSPDLGTSPVDSFGHPAAPVPAGAGIGNPQRLVTRVFVSGATYRGALEA